MPLAVLAALWDTYDLGHRHWLRGRAIRIGPIHTHTTSLVSGLLFIGIGILFLLTAGTANLGGLLSADTAVTLQGWLARISTHVSNLLLALLIVLVVIGVLTRRIRRTAETRAYSTKGSDHHLEPGGPTSPAPDEKGLR